jgi:hypothetical protein
MSLLALNLKVAGNHVITKSLNVVLPLSGIMLMFVYEYCDTSCTYLKGSFLGIDLKWVGIIYMVALFVSTFSVRESATRLVGHLRTIMISAAVGIEFFLIGFQVVKDIYCPFCLLFSASIFILFGVNYTSMNRGLMIASGLAGLLGFTLFFEGQVNPSFDV